MWNQLSAFGETVLEQTNKLAENAFRPQHQHSDHHDGGNVKNLTREDLEGLDTEQLHNLILTQQERLKNGSENSSNLNAQVKQLTSEKEDIQQKLNSLKSKAKVKINDLQGKIDNLTKEKEEILQANKNNSDNSTNNNDNDNSAILTDLEAKLQNLQEELRSKEGIISNMESQINNKTLELEKLEVELRTQSEIPPPDTSDLDLANARIEELQHQLRKLQAELNTQNSTQQLLESLEQSKVELTQQVEELNDQQRSALEKFKEQETYIQALQQKESELLSELETYRTESSDEKKDYLAELDNLTKQNEQLKEDLTRSMLELGNLRQDNEAAVENEKFKMKATAKIKQLKQDNESLKEQLESISNANTEKENIFLEYNKWIEDIARQIGLDRKFEYVNDNSFTDYFSELKSYIENNKKTVENSAPVVADEEENQDKQIIQQLSLDIRRYIDQIDEKNQNIEEIKRQHEEMSRENQNIVDALNVRIQELEQANWSWKDTEGGFKAGLDA